MAGSALMEAKPVSNGRVQKTYWGSSLYFWHNQPELLSEAALLKYNHCRVIKPQ